MQEERNSDPLCSNSLNKKRNIKLISKILANIDKIEENFEFEAKKGEAEDEDQRRSVLKEYDKFKDPKYLKFRLLKIKKFWRKKVKLRRTSHSNEPNENLPATNASTPSTKASKPKNRKSKEALKKLRVQGKFMSLESAMQLLNDKKRLKEMKMGKVELKRVLKDYQGKIGRKKR